MSASVVCVICKIIACCLSGEHNAKLNDIVIRSTSRRSRSPRDRDIDRSRSRQQRSRSRDYHVDRGDRVRDDYRDSGPRERSREPVLRERSRSREPYIRSSDTTAGRSGDSRRYETSDRHREYSTSSRSSRHWAWIGISTSARRGMKVRFVNELRPVTWMI